MVLDHKMGGKRYGTGHRGATACGWARRRRHGYVLSGSRPFVGRTQMGQIGGLVSLCITIYKVQISFLLSCEICSEVYKKSHKM